MRKIPYGRQYIDDEDIESVVTSLRSDWLTTGPRVAEFEKTFASTVGSSYAVAVNNGTFALQAALKVLNLAAEDEVLVPSITFSATANAVVLMGGKPVFVDVDPDTLLVDLEDLKSKITSKTRAILSVDFAGQPVDYDQIRELCKRHALVFISDGCHALGATYHSSPVGSIADLTVFSFHPVKHIATGEGGMITTETTMHEAEMKRYRNHGLDSDFRTREEKGAWQYDMVDLGSNGRLTDFQSALGISQLKKLPGFLQKRREIASYYDELFSDVEHIKPLLVKTGREHAYHLYVVRVGPLGDSSLRDKLFHGMRERGIGVNVHYAPVHLFSWYKNHYGTGRGDCPLAEKVAENLLTLPLFPAMTNDDVEYIVRNLLELSD